MGIGSGVDTQFGMKAESTFGTAVTVDKFTYINSESIKADVMKMDSPHLGTMVLKTTQTKTVVTGAAGNVELPFFNKGMGTLLKQCFGALTSTQIAAGAEYRHRFTPDTTSGKRGVMATVQVGRASVDGTVRPFTYEGGKVTAFEIEMPEKGLLILRTEWVFEDEATGTALASASYATNLEMFDWSDATVSLAGTSVFVRSFRLRGEWAYDIDRRGLSQLKRKEPIVNGTPGLKVTGEMEGEFESLTHYNAFTAGTQEAMNFTVTGSTIPTTANPYKVLIDSTKIVLTGDTPNVGGPEILTQPLPFEALYDGTNAIVQMDYHNDEVSY